jgi:protein O-mannosyl-transferase
VSGQSGAVDAHTSQTAYRAKILGARGKLFILSALLIIATIAIYYPVHRFAFLPNVDDAAYVTQNTHVLGPLDWPEIQWALTHPYALNYDPLTFLAHSVNVRLFQLNPGRHHGANVLWHAVNALLLFWLLKRSTGFTGRSFVVAALFTVHPINVENVAWIAELKTLLSAAFFFAAMIAYLGYARRPNLFRMLWVGFLYGLGLLAKPQVITLPFVLLLWDYWPLRRLLGAVDDGSLETASNQRFHPQRAWRLVAEKWPLFIVMAIDTLLTLRAEKKPGLERYTFLIRLGTAIRSYVVYLGKAFWPANLAFSYPHPGYSLRWGEVWAALALLVAITTLVVIYRQYRYLLVGWFWFVGTMVPTINLVQIDLPAVADRYAYICFVGLFLMVCWGVADGARQRRFSPIALRAVTVAVLVSLAVVSHQQVRYWRDGVAVWTRSLQVVPYHNPGAEWALGTLLVEGGRVGEGLSHIYKSLEEKPRDASDTTYVAEIEQGRGNHRQAILLYQEALASSKDDRLSAQIYANMGHAYNDLGDWTRALECYRAAQRIRSLLPNGGQ